MCGCYSIYEPMDCYLAANSCGRLAAGWPRQTGGIKWVKDPTYQKQQPYFIRLKTEGAIFFVALAHVHQGLQPDEHEGFVVITTDSDQGMIDIQGLRQVVLSAEHQGLAHQGVPECSRVLTVLLRRSVAEASLITEQLDFQRQLRNGL